MLIRLRVITEVSSHSLISVRPSTFQEPIMISPSKDASTSVWIKRFLPDCPAGETCVAILVRLRCWPHQAGALPLPLPLSTLAAARPSFILTVSCNSMNSLSFWSSAHCFHLGSTHSSFSSKLRTLTLSRGIPPTDICRES